MPRPRAVAAAALLAVVAFAAWRLWPRPVSLHHDLARLLRLAAVSGPRDVLLFGSPGAEPHLASGFYATGGLGSEPFVWARPEVELTFDWPRPEARAAVLDLAPLPGLSEQTARVSLNGTPVGEIRLNDDRSRYRLSLPASAQKAGLNRLAFAFAKSSSPAEIDPTTGDRRTLAAAFRFAVVAAASDPGLDDLLGRDAPEPLSASSIEDQAAIVQTGPGSVSYAFVLDPGLEFRASPRLHPAARSAASTVKFELTLEELPGVREKLWSATLGPKDAPPGEVRVSLGKWEGRPVRLALHVSGSDRYAWGIWGSPGLHGPGSPRRPGLPAPELSPGPSKELEALRANLSGLDVVFVILDAARAFQFGSYGYSRETTPQIDRFAKEAVVFDRAYTPAAYTLAAMSAVWTSQYPDRHRSDLSFAARLPKDKLTLAEVLSSRGVANAGFVANAMAGTAPGFERGFAEFHEVFRFFPELGSRGEAMRRVVPPWFEKHAKERFFAYVHFREPHFPYDPGPPWDTKFGPDAPLGLAERRDSSWYKDVSQGVQKPTPEQIAHLVRLYDGNLASVDHEVGELLAALEKNGLLEKSVVILAADHGEQLYEKGYISHSAQVYEESARIPLMIRFPKSLQLGGKRIGELVDLLDVAPTVLDVMGLSDGPYRKQAQGRSLLEVIAGAPGKDAVLSRTVWERPVYALRDRQFKLIHDTRTGRSELFDVESDPRERGDLASRAPIRAESMELALYEWLSRLKPAGAAAQAEKSTLTREQCENMKSLGYLDPGTPCPAS